MVVAVSTLILVACVQHSKAQGWKAVGLRSLRRSRPLPAPPPDDLPPAGLAPLIPTQRAIASEFERGLRDLTLYLAVEGRD
jgi:hypothetical protein